MDVLEALMCVIDSLQTETASGGVLVDAELDVGGGATVTFERDDMRHIYRIDLTKVGSTKVGAFE